MQFFLTADSRRPPCSSGGRFAPLLAELRVLPTLDNPKGELQEKLQANLPEAPRYRLVSVSGPDHDRVFECAVFHQQTELGRGSGKSKKQAESQAAIDALSKLGDLPPE